jgi:hypothetical protein
MPDTCPTWCRSPYCPKLADDADRCHQTAPIGEHDEVFLDAEKLTHEYLKVDIGSLDALTPPSIQVYISADRGGGRRAPRPVSCVGPGTRRLAHRSRRPAGLAQLDLLSHGVCVMEFDASSCDFAVEEVERVAQRQRRLLAFQVFLVGG